MSGAAESKFDGEGCNSIADCYLTSFLTIVILGVGFNAKPDLTLETWAHQKALERLQQHAVGAAESAE